MLSGKRAALLLFVLSLTGRGAVAAELLSLERDGVKVEFGHGDRSRAGIVHKVIEEARRELARDLGLRAPDRFLVRIVRTADAFSGVFKGQLVELYAGVAYPSRRLILINAEALDRAQSQLAMSRTLRHEFVHLAVGHSIGQGRLPKWFEEGLACMFGSPLPRDEISRLRYSSSFRLSSLRSFPRDKDGMTTAYAQSEAVVRYLVSEHSLESVKELLLLVADGKAFEWSLDKACSLSVETLEARWRATMQPTWFEKALLSVMGQGRPILWASLFVVIGFFFVRRRRRRMMEEMDDGF